MSLKDQHNYPDHFYGRRKGRPLRVYKKQLMEDFLQKLEIPRVSENILDPSTLFPSRINAYALEIGFGGGEHLAVLAKTHQQRGFIGCEAFENGVASLLQHLEENGASENVRIYPKDVRPFLRVLKEGSIDFSYILFPDPWPKKRHHKRRIINTDLLKELYRLMKQGGELRIATDDPSYQEWIREKLEECALLFRIQACYSSDSGSKPQDWPDTRYEQKALNVGRTCLYWVLIRR